MLAARARLTASTATRRDGISFLCQAKLIQLAVELAYTGRDSGSKTLDDLWDHSDSRSTPASLVPESDHRLKSTGAPGRKPDGNERDEAQDNRHADEDGGIAGRHAKQESR